MIFSVKAKDKEIAELRAQANQHKLAMDAACAEIELWKAECRKQRYAKIRLRFLIGEFKKFSPRLWFEYFSTDAGKFSAAKRALAAYEKWRIAEDARSS